MKPLLPLALLLFCGAAQAIIMRHDRGYTDYEARESQYPAVFYLQKKGRSKLCVATLIHPRWAITAAHCSEETALGQSMAEGQPYPVRIASSVVEIDRLVVHPDYNPRNKPGRPDVDLALLRLSERLEIPRPMPVYRGSEELESVVTLLGWGFSGLGTVGSQRSDGRLRAAQNRIDTANRRLRFTFDDPRGLHSQALALEGLPGLGDSGGPALLDAGEGLRIGGVAVGELLPGGSEPRAQGLYGAVAIYERLSWHLDWIDATVARSE